MKMFKFKLLSGFLAILLLSSCENFDQYVKGQFQEVDTSTYIMWDGTFALPLVDSKITLASLLPDADTTKTWIEADENNLLHIFYKEETAYETPGSSVGINTTIPEGTNLTIPEVGPFWTSPIALSFFSDVPPGVVYFKDPKITLSFTSELPVELDVRLDSIYFENTERNEKVEGDCDITFKIPAAGTEIAVLTNAVVTNFSQGLSILPNQFGVKYAVGINAQTQGEVNPAQKVIVDYLVDLPLDLYVKDMVITDTSDFDLGGDATQLVKDLTLRIVTKNKMALGTSLFIVLTDSTYQDTIATIKELNADANDKITLPFQDGARDIPRAYKLEPCPTDALGNTLDPQTVVKEVVVPKYAIDAINEKHPTKMIIGVKFNTYNSDAPQLVKITSKDYIDLKIGTKVIFEAKTK